MKQTLFLVFLVLSAFLRAQGQNNGALIFDFNKKKNQHTDSVKQTTPAENTGDTTPSKPRPKKQPAGLNTGKPGDWYDYKTEGVFSGLFHAGFNTAQIDGDNEWGYRYFGFEGGAGALARFHKIISLSLELDYSMVGAKATYPSSPQNFDKYQVQLDYVQAAVAVNAHYKRWLMISAGIAPGYLLRYKEFDDDGINVTQQNLTNQPGTLGEPRKFGMVGFGSLHFILKSHYALGAKFSYSMIEIRGGEPDTRVNGEYNNFFSFEFMYILCDVKKK